MYFKNLSKHYLQIKKGGIKTILKKLKSLILIFIQLPIYFISIPVFMILTLILLYLL